MITASRLSELVMTGIQISSHGLRLLQSGDLQTICRQTSLQVETSVALWLFSIFHLFRFFPEYFWYILRKRSNVLDTCYQVPIAAWQVATSHQRRIKQRTFGPWKFIYSIKASIKRRWHPELDPKYRHRLSASLWNETKVCFLKSYICCSSQHLLWFRALFSCVGDHQTIFNILS